MPSMEYWLHTTFVIVFVVTFGISSVYRTRARRAKPGVTRLQEGPRVLLLRITGAIPVVLMILAYAIHPPWVGWASVPLPTWLRWVGVFAGITAMVGLWWVFASIGAPGHPSRRVTGEPAP